ncbi:MAG: lysine-sensitive aspartokinase 3 [candidate division KSB1 bacterium]|nr:lysine-sensitive aspartokinase 3 [candidate division KSB1 bacterium]
MLVMKFGGTSVGNAAAIQRVCSIIAGRSAQKPVVVTSAVGGVTNKLVRLSKLAGQGERKDAESLLEEIIIQHRTIAEELDLFTDQVFAVAFQQAEALLREAVARVFADGRLTDESYDAVISTGEFFTANMLPAVLRKNGLAAVFADARAMMMTDDHFSAARPLLDESTPRARSILVPIVQSGKIPVTQGFVGSTLDGRTTTLGRGGSDYSATLFGAMLQVGLVEIWSDVDGVLTADPSLVPDAHRIRYMSFQEAAELAYFGAKVLHPATLAPAVERDMTVKVLNSMNPSFDGTAISKHRPVDALHEGRVKSIAYKEGLTVITVISDRMLMAYGFMAKVFSVFEKYETPVDLVATSEVSVSMTIDNTRRLEEIVAELAQIGSVQVEKGKAIVCLVGDGLKKAKGIPGQVFGLLQDTRISLISQGASEINLSFVIDEDDLKRVVPRLHDYFFQGELDPRVFA